MHTKFYARSVSLKIFLTIQILWGIIFQRNMNISHEDIWLDFEKAEARKYKHTGLCKKVRMHKMYV